MIRELRVWRREVPSSGEDERPGVQAKRIRRFACVWCVWCVCLCVTANQWQFIKINVSYKMTGLNIPQGPLKPKEAHSPVSYQSRRAAGTPQASTRPRERLA